MMAEVRLTRVVSPGRGPLRLPGGVAVLPGALP